MKFHELFKVLEAGTKIAIDTGDAMLKYKVYELGEDTLYYEEIKDRIVKEVWYSPIYNAIIIELE